MAGLLLNFGADVKQATAGIKEVSLSLKEQQGILQKLKYEYAYLDAAQRKTSFGKTMAADIRIASAEIANLKATSSSSFGAIGSSATKALSGLRSIAYILPGIGIAGLFNVAFNALEKLFSGMDSAPSHLQNFNAAFSGAKDKFVDAASSVFQLRSEIDLARQGFISKEGVVKHFNDTIGKTVGVVTSLNEAERQLIENGGAYIQMTLQKAVAEVAAGKAAEKLFELAELRNKVLSSGGKAPLLAESLSPGIGVKAINARASELKRQIEDFKSIMNEANRQASLFGFNFFDSFKSDKAGSQKKIKESIRAALGSIQIELEPILSTTPAAISKIKQSVLRIQNEINKSSDFSKLDLSRPSIAGNPEAFKKLQDDMKNLAELGRLVGTTLADSFGQVFDAVAQGENVFKALGEAVKALVLDLIKAAIQTAIISAIMNIFVPGSGAAAKGTGILGKLLSGRAAGGPVGSGQPYIVGETGKELFIPSSSGRIIPNNQLNSLQGSAVGGQYSERLITRISGGNLDLILQRFGKYKLSNV